MNVTNNRDMSMYEFKIMTYTVIFILLQSFLILNYIY